MKKRHNYKHVIISKRRLCTVYVHGCRLPELACLPANGQYADSGNTQADADSDDNDDGRC